MKTLKYVILSICLISSVTFAFEKPRLECKNGSAYLTVVTYDTGCHYPAQAYFKKLLLESTDPESGTLEIELGYTFSTANPNCDNPRGRPHFHYLPIPLSVGSWDIKVGDSYKTKLNLNDACSIQE